MREPETALSKRDTLTAFLARLEAAEGPNRVLDADIKRYLAPTERGYNQVSPPYTASLDAALALCERVLPKSGWGLQSNTKGQRGQPRDCFWATVGMYEPGRYDGAASTPALALLSALLRALIANEAQT